MDNDLVQLKVPVLRIKFLSHCTMKCLYIDYRKSCVSLSSCAKKIVSITPS